uniref:Uncharacterized protein n=1 Tax=Aegilops tauschii subsp. strangulata TaxID=200361 RepID=A0A453RPF5_AEGTS
ARRLPTPTRTWRSGPARSWISIGMLIGMASRIVGRKPSRWWSHRRLGPRHRVLARWLLIVICNVRISSQKNVLLAPSRLVSFIFFLRGRLVSFITRERII